MRAEAAPVSRPLSLSSCTTSRSRRRRAPSRRLATGFKAAARGLLSFSSRPVHVTRRGLRSRGRTGGSIREFASLRRHGRGAGAVGSAAPGAALGRPRYGAVPRQAVVLQYSRSLNKLPYSS